MIVGLGAAGSAGAGGAVVGGVEREGNAAGGRRGRCRLERCRTRRRRLHCRCLHLRCVGQHDEVAGCVDAQADGIPLPQAVPLDEGCCLLHHVHPAVSRTSVSTVCPGLDHELVVAPTCVYCCQGVSPVAHDKVEVGFDHGARQDDAAAVGIAGGEHLGHQHSEPRLGRPLVRPLCRHGRCCPAALTPSSLCVSLGLGGGFAGVIGACSLLGGGNRQGGLRQQCASSGAAHAGPPLQPRL
mmetsp:Transcript_9575/g.28821  ORF Transcript_9575/g.28821 Transcript_9575/m.28821 type:complete len:240 (+) Transcript_9575:2809-3528(+)